MISRSSGIFFSKPLRVILDIPDILQAVAVALSQGNARDVLILVRSRGGVPVFNDFRQNSRREA